MGRENHKVDKIYNRENKIIHIYNIFPDCSLDVLYVICNNMICMYSSELKPF